MSTRRAWHATRAGWAMVALLAGTSAGGATIQPVGPETEGVYIPTAMNERGDVLYWYWASTDEGWDGQTPPIQTEVRYADGGTLRLRESGFLTIDPALLMENGDVVARYGTPGEPLPGGGTLENQEWRLVAREGGSTVVEGTRPYFVYHSAARDGTLLGNASMESGATWVEGEERAPFVPEIWRAATGPVEVELPPGLAFGSVGWAVPGGGYVGGASEGTLDGRQVMLWWDEAGSIEATVEVTGLAERPVWRTVGARADGAIVGDVDGRIFALTPDGALTFVTGEKAELRTFDVNASGVVIGDYFDSVWKNVAWTADGTEIDLGSYFAGTGWEIGHLVDITDRGDVLVDAFRPNSSVSRAFVIHGVPGPGSAALGCVAGLLTVWRRRR